MASGSQQQDKRDRAVATLTTTIEVLNVTKDVCCIPPAQAAFAAASALLTTIKDSTANKQDNVDLGLFCADVCRALDRGLHERQLEEINQSVLEAINQLTITVAAIRDKIESQGKRSAASRFIQARYDKDKIATWRQDLGRILQIFNTELALDTHKIVTEINRRHDPSAQLNLAQSTVPPGEFPPPAPRACIGRDALIEEVVGLAENLEPIALIGAGGIGKTSIALSVLHHTRIKERFGVNRRFIRCDQFPASRLHLLARLSKVIGAGVENPEDLTPLRPLLASTEMFIVLDNAESVLDPQGPNAQEIYDVVDELCQFDKICLCITSRIRTVPEHCKHPEIPTLSMEAACGIFYRIYHRERSSVINDLLKQLDFHALSVMLLATTASHNMWDHTRLTKEWNTRRAQVLHADHKGSLATTIELSLTSPTFQNLGPDARDLLGVIAFFPQGIDENNLDWLFPTISDVESVFDKFCTLSLTYRNNNFVTMLAPLRDYLRPQDPRLSQLFCATKDHYFTRLSVNLVRERPEFQEARWIVSEDLNVEHLLDVFTSIDADSISTWYTCFHFMVHLYFHKPRQTILGPKIMALPDNHRSKPRCVHALSLLLDAVGKFPERKKLLLQVLQLQREWGGERDVATVLAEISSVNRILGHHEEGIRQIKEALEIRQRLGGTIKQAQYLKALAWSLYSDGQLDASEDAASRAINLAPEKGQEFLLCESHRVLGEVYCSKGRKEDALRHFEIALQIAAPFNWKAQALWTHCSIAQLFVGEDEFDYANDHVAQAKILAVGDPYSLARSMELQAKLWCRQDRLEDAESEISSAMDIFERLGSSMGVEDCRALLSVIEQARGDKSDPTVLSVPSNT